MNISFFDGVNDGKFYSINAGKYDELGEEDVDISADVEEEDEEDANTCLNRFAALEKDASKLHMDLNNLRNEFKGSCKDWNNLSDTVDHMLNSIAELKAIMDLADDRLNKRLNVISEANVVLTDKLNLVEKKLEVFKRIDISEEIENEDGRNGYKSVCYRGVENFYGLPCEECECPGLEEVKNEISTHLAMINKVNMRLNQLGNKISDLKEFRDETYELQYGQLLDRLNLIEKKLEVFKCIDILDRVTKLEEQVKPTVLEEAKELEVRPSVLDDILDKVSRLEEKIINTQLTLHSIDLKSNALEKKINEELDWKDLTGTTVFESIKNGILDSIKRLEEDSVSNDIQDDPVNHPSHYTDGKYETIDFIEEYGTITHIGNAIKYASRAGKKDEDAYIEDLKKGLWYLHRYNCPPKKKHIDVLDYCKEKKLPDELTNVLIAISRENYVEAERVLRKYIEELKK